MVVFWRARAAAVAARCGPRHAASTDGRIRARRRRCDGAGACDGAANDALRRPFRIHLLQLPLKQPLLLKGQAQVPRRDGAV